MSALEVLLLGIVSGFSPGPIMSLALGESLKHGKKRALTIPLSILVANLFIAPLMITTLAIGNRVDGFLILVPYLGAILLISMGILEWKNAGIISTSTSAKPFLKAIGIDLLSPFGYLIWLTVLGPTALLAWKNHGFLAVATLYILFMGGAIVSLSSLVIGADLIRPLLNSRHVSSILKLLSLSLIFFGLKLLI